MRDKARSFLERQQHAAKFGDIVSVVAMSLRLQRETRGLKYPKATIFSALHQVRPTRIWLALAPLAPLAPPSQRRGQRIVSGQTALEVEFLALRGLLAPMQLR